jgi:hypothetical protein
MPFRSTELDKLGDMRMGIEYSALPLFTPLNVNPVLWLDGADANSITESGGNVSQWNDKSGTGNHAVQTVGSNQPTYNSVDGYVEVNTTLTMEFASSILTGATSASLFIVADNVTNGNTAWGGFPRGDDYYIFGDGNIYSTFCSTSRTSINFNGQILTPTLIEIIHDGSNHIYYRNGNSIGSVASTFSVPATSPPGQVLGGRGQYRIYELVLLNNDASSDDREKLEGFLTHKHSLTAELPALHPYKNNPP